MGQQLAKINIPTAVAMLLREFHMELAPEVSLLCRLPRSCHSAPQTLR